MKNLQRYSNVCTKTLLKLMYRMLGYMMRLTIQQWWIQWLLRPTHWTSKWVAICKISYVCILRDQNKDPWIVTNLYKPQVKRFSCVHTTEEITSNLHTPMTFVTYFLYGICCHVTVLRALSRTNKYERVFLGISHVPSNLPFHAAHEDR